ncbi:receptor family ligand binding region domain-containing protein [Ditylenchus destructor]|nr:receptor family ligand binding region domain-containing protein [Ditylenchus destructor]
MIFLLIHCLIHISSAIEGSGEEPAEVVRLVSGGGASRPKKELHIGGVFPMEAGSGGWPGGQACLPAVEMALEDINSDETILPNYALKLHHHNSKCQPGLAAKQLFELLYKPPTKLMLLSGCSPVTTVIAESAPVWNLIVLSYGASSPALSNRARFPTLFRTHPSANMQNPTRVHIFEKFKWRKITILQSVEEVFTSTAKDLEEQCRERGIRVDRQSFYGDPTDAVKTLIRQDARIIVGLFYVTEARRVLCQAYHHGLYGRRFVWFMIGWYADTWYVPVKSEGLNCTREQMEEAAEYHFTTESIMLSRDSMPAISGMTGRQFQRRLENMIKTDPANTGGFPEAPLAYDAVWALALAMNCTQHSLPYGVFLEDFAYNNAIIADQMFECVKNTQFKGVSGQVMFSDLGDRIARTQIEQMQNGKYTILGFYDTTSQTLEWMSNEKWHGNRGPPPDSTIIRRRYITVNLMLYSVVLFVMTVGLGLAISAFIFNRRFSHRRIIIQSQPECNNMLIFGCALCLLSLVFMGLPVDGGLAFPSESFVFLCHTRVSLLMVGFTFAYGSLFAKVWIVHRLGASENQELAAIKEDEDGSPWESIRMLIAAMVGRQALVAAALRKISNHAYGSLIARRPCLLNQPIPTEKFYSVIGSLFLVDFVIISFWLALDPLQRIEQSFSLQEPPAGTDEDVMLLPILELCQSSQQEVWIVLVLAYKGLLLLFGLFLAFESRHLKLRHVNDSRLVHLAICNVSVLSLITGPIVIFFLRHQANSFYAFVCATVLLCTYISLGLIFIPKVIHIYKSPQSTPDDGGSSDQLRFQQLVKENNELKRQIEIRKLKIAECRRLLGKRLMAAGVSNTASSSAVITNLKAGARDLNTITSLVTTDEGFSSIATIGVSSTGTTIAPQGNSSIHTGNTNAGYVPGPRVSLDASPAAAVAVTLIALTGIVTSTPAAMDNNESDVLGRPSESDYMTAAEEVSSAISSADTARDDDSSSSEEILL